MPTPTLSAERHFREAASLAKRGRLQEAAGSWIAGLELDPGNVPGYLQLGAVCRHLCRTQAALEALQCALRLEPRQPDVWREMGLTYRATEMHKDAGECFSQALRLDPADLEARLA